MRVAVHPIYGAGRPRLMPHGMGGPVLPFRVVRPRRGMGCSDVGAANYDGSSTADCTYAAGSSQAAAGAPVTGVVASSAVPAGSYNPGAASYTPGNQPAIGGGYEPVQTLQSWLASEVVQPAANAPTTGQPYQSPTALAAQLTQAAASYCEGVASGGPNNPCAGVDQGAVVQQLTQSYAAQIASQGANPASEVTLANEPSYDYTAYTPGYDSGGAGYILMPNGTSVPNSPANLAAAAMAASTVPSANSGGGAGSGQTTSGQSYSAAVQPGVTQVGSGASAGSVATSSGIDLSWFTESMIAGIPNWALVGGGVLVLFMFTGRK